MIEVVAVAVASLGVALCRYLSVRTFVKHANKKDIPAIARAVYPRLQLGRGRRPDLDGKQPEGGPSPESDLDRGSLPGQG
jgi:hypothetical protein